MRKKKIINETVELEIESLAFQGFGVARLEGFVYFVKHAIPGDKVLASILKKKKKHAEAKIEKIISPSPLRIEPKCKYFGVCGGCSLQNFDYSEQLKWKKQQVEDSFQRIGNFSDFKVENPIGSSEIFYYRNKMDFSFANSRWLLPDEISSDELSKPKDFALGLHFPTRYDKVIDIDYCYIQQSTANDILTYFRNTALDFGISGWSNKTYDGFLRNLIIRYSFTQEKFMLILISNEFSNQAEKDFLEKVKIEVPKLFPNVASFHQAVNTTNNPVKVENQKLLFGSEFITENILGIDYQISPFSFFQTNSQELNSFVSNIINFTGAKESDIVWDLYCGTGTITFPLSKKVKKIIGFELSEEAVFDAKKNEKLNGIENAVFIQEDLHKKNIAEKLTDYERPDVITIDPPRAGMHPSLVELVLSSGAKRIVYVSCNPTTQARDCALLSEKYKLIKVLPYDMFPHTFHIEAIAELLIVNC